MKRLIRTAGAVILSATLFTCLTGFGTTHSFGQNAEHERITRHALSCQYDGVREKLGGFCFQTDTIKTLAGGPGEFGAIGEPDSGRLVFLPKAHCDLGDYMNKTGYPHSKHDAYDALYACRAWMVENLHAAVAEAPRLLKDGQVDVFQSRTDCTFMFRMDGKAKCNILERLGLMLHASEDFYSHSNWTDFGSSSTDINKPPGMGKTGPAPFISLRENAQGQLDNVPDGLMTGCFTANKLSSFCDGRVTHAVLNKDEGTIDPSIQKPKTDRGKVTQNGVSNFQRAVEAAIADTQDKWLLFHQKLVAAYGEKSARKMECIITSDAPSKTCKMSV